IEHRATLAVVGALRAEAASPCMSVSPRSRADGSCLAGHGWPPDGQHLVMLMLDNRANELSSNQTSRHSPRLKNQAARYSTPKRAQRSQCPDVVRIRLTTHVGERASGNGTCGSARRSEA